MNSYVIKIDGKYFKSLSDVEIGRAPAGGWYDKGRSVKKVELTPDLLEAKLIEGELNLNSYWNKLYDTVRFGNFKFDRLEIVRVDV